VSIACYHEMGLPVAGDPLRIVAGLAGSGLFDQYVVYENGAEWSFAGRPLFELRLPGVRLRSLAPVEDFLAQVPVAEWRAYGWAAFELTHALAAGYPVTEDLVHLMIPEVEVRVRPGRILLRAMGKAQLIELADLLDCGAPAREPGPAVHLAVDLADGGSYRTVVAAVVERIRGGAVDKVIVSRSVPVAGAVDLVASYVSGRSANTPARSFLLDLGRMRAAGFSPETVVQVSEDGLVTTQPLAGTRARCGFAPEDSRLREELVTDPKEVYEHAISVRAAQEEIAELCGGTAQVTEFMAVRERGSVQHLASAVRGPLSLGRSPWDAFAKLFPAVTASGVPKTAACALIRELEPYERGLYAGAVLTCDHRANLDAALVLRSIYQRDGRTWLQAGAGIMAQSTPEREHEETCEKLASVAAHLVAGEQFVTARDGDATKTGLGPA
jgi:salicylate synthase